MQIAVLRIPLRFRTLISLITGCLRIRLAKNSTHCNSIEQAVHLSTAALYLEKVQTCFLYNNLPFSHRLDIPLLTSNLNNSSMFLMNDPKTDRAVNESCLITVDMQCAAEPVLL